MALFVYVVSIWKLSTLKPGLHSSKFATQRNVRGKRKRNTHNARIEASLRSGCCVACITLRLSAYIVSCVHCVLACVVFLHRLRHLRQVCKGLASCALRWLDLVTMLLLAGGLVRPKTMTTTLWVKRRRSQYRRWFATGWRWHSRDHSPVCDCVRTDFASAASLTPSEQASSSTGRCVLISC